MLHHMEYVSKNDESSQNDTEYHSESGSELEEGTTASEEDTFLSIQYPSLPHFPTPYLHNWDSRDSDQALKCITKHFNPESITKSLKSFPDLSHNFISSNTFVDPTQSTLLEHYIQKSILDHNAFVQKQLELQVRYSISDINHFILQCIL